MINPADIKYLLNEYLEFDSNRIFMFTDYLVVFGGALRDILAEQPYKINDVDILCLSRSKKYAEHVFAEQGYKSKRIFNPHIHEMYKGIRYIFEPKTFVKGHKIVQLITPRTENLRIFKNHYDNLRFMKRAFYDLLSNVDLSSSGTFFDGNFLYESTSNSIHHCINKKYTIYPDAKMFNSKRVKERIHNLGNEWSETNENDLALFLKIKNNNLNLQDFKNKLV